MAPIRRFVPTQVEMSGFSQSKNEPAVATLEALFFLIAAFAAAINR